MKSLKSPWSMPLMLAVLLAGGGILAATAHALPIGSPDGKPRCEAGAGQQLQSREAYHAQRMAALKEKLKLAPGQQAAWTSFAAALQPAGQPGTYRMAMHAEFAKLNTAERLDRMTDMSEARHARMTARADAIKAFYGQLTPEQQKVFDTESIPQRAHPGQHRGRNV